VVIVTAGVPRKPGMSRDDLIGINLGVMKSVGEAHQAPRAERLRHLHHQPARRDGVGAAEILGPARPRTSSAWPACWTRRASPTSSPKRPASRLQDVNAWTLGGHGDDMVPMVRHSTIGGLPLPDCVKQGMFTQAELDAMVDRTRKGGGEIVALLKTGSAFYAPAEIGHRDGEVLSERPEARPARAPRTSRGEYGISDLYVGVPALIGAGGVEKVIVEFDQPTPPKRRCSPSRWPRCRA
jgi:malate dehydrogenase